MGPVLETAEKGDPEKGLDREFKKSFLATGLTYDNIRQEVIVLTMRFVAVGSARRPFC